MPKDSEPDPGGWQPLVSTPLAVVRRLKEPILLAGMGAAALIAIVAVFVPSTGRTYAWLIAGLIFLLCLVWAVTAPLRRPPLDEPGKGTNVVVMGDRAQILDSTFEASRSNLHKTGKDAVIEGTVFRAGAESRPRRKPPGKRPPGGRQGDS